MDTVALPPSETDARPAIEFWDVLEVRDEAQLSAEQKLTLHSFELSVRELCSEADYDLLVRRFVAGQTIEEVLAARNLEPSQAAALYKHQSRLLLRLREELKKKGYG
jgi:hypothetical protein